MCDVTIKASQALTRNTASVLLEFCYLLTLLVNDVFQLTLTDFVTANLRSIRHLNAHFVLRIFTPGLDLQYSTLI